MSTFAFQTHCVLLEVIESVNCVCIQMNKFIINQNMTYLILLVAGVTVPSMEQEHVEVNPKLGCFISLLKLHSLQISDFFSDFFVVELFMVCPPEVIPESGPLFKSSRSAFRVLSVLSEILVMI